MYKYKSILLNMADVLQEKVKLYNRLMMNTSSLFFIKVYFLLSSFCINALIIRLLSKKVVYFCTLPAHTGYMYLFYLCVDKSDKKFEC